MSTPSDQTHPSSSASEPRVTLDVVAWICLQDQHILCARTAGNDLFYLPGGKREPGESDWAAISREVKEEMGVMLIEGTLSETFIIEEKAHGYTQSTWVIMKCFQAAYSGHLSPQSEIEEMTWMHYTDKEKCAPATQRVLEQLFEKHLIN